MRDRQTTPTTYPSNQAVSQLFDAQVERTPTGTAVISGTSSMTYRALSERADRLASRLRAHGVTPGVCVALAIERSADLVVAMIATLKAGGAYVPLDLGWPDARMAFILADTQAGLVLTNAAHLARASSWSPTATLDISAAALGGAANAEVADDRARPVSPTPLDVAYVMYTSGSTGRPKGVEILHRGIVRLVWGLDDILVLDARQRLLHLASPAFDASTFEIWAALLHGGTCIVAGPGVPTARQLGRQLLEHRVTILFLTTALFNAIVDDDPSVLTAVQHVLVGGEALSAAHVRRAQAKAPDTRFSNVYGPTEATAFTSWYSIPTPLDPACRSVPIGRPIGHTDVYLLDAQLMPVPVGEPGELCIGGDGLARGYLGQPTLTAQRFVPRPFGTPGARLYRSGDRARELPDGTLEFLGRVDEQVKIRGFRIEPGEIEHALRGLAGVRDAVVTVYHEAEGEKRLVAYVVMDDGCPPAAGADAALQSGLRTERELREALEAQLPGYLIPSDIVLLNELPLTTSGKLDRTALPVPASGRSRLRTNYIAPRSDTERLFAQVWSSVLGVDPVGVDDNFFELGGHSLRAAQMSARVRHACGVELPLSLVFATPTIAALASAVAHRTLLPVTSSVQAIPMASRAGPIPLSFSQERVWFLQQLNPESRAYHFQRLLRFHGPLDVGALRSSLQALVQRHEILRTTFHDDSGDVVQRIHPAFDCELPVVDLRVLSPDIRRRAADEVIEREVATRINLSRLPLVRWTLLQFADDQCELLHLEHHLTHDGWSFNVFRRELLQFYRAYTEHQTAALPPLAIQFADFAAWERARERRGDFQPSLAYWTQQLCEPPVLALPMAAPRAQVPTYDGALHSVELPAELYAALRTLSERHGATLFMTLVSAFFVLLHRYSGQRDLLVGSGVANRGWSDTEHLLGMLVNNVVLRSRLDANPSFLEFLEGVRTTTVDAYTRQEVPFDHVVRALGQRSEPGRNPLFQVMFSFHDSPLDELVLPGLDVSSVEAFGNGSAKFDLNVIVVPHAEQRTKAAGDRGSRAVTLLWEYDTALFSDDAIARMSSHYCALLSAVAADPMIPVLSLDMLSAAERWQLIEGWNQTDGPYPSDRTVPQLFDDQARQTPNAIALVDDVRPVSYQTVNLRARGLAARLRTAGVAPGDRVVLAIERSADLVVAMLATLETGAAYVPLDLSWPDARIAFIAEDAQARLVLTTAAHGARVAQWSVAWLNIADDESRAAPADRSASPSQDERRFPSIGPLDIAYVMYTSGSTGTPKGVEISHRSIVHLVWSLDGIITLDATQRLLHLSSPAFDASTFEVWGALLRGATCVVASPGVSTARELGALLRAQRVTTLWLTSAYFNAIIDDWPGALEPVRQLLVGGDVLSVAHVRRAQAALPDVAIVNGYGPTEATTFASCHRVPAMLAPDCRSVSIGRPIGHTQIYILDAYLQPTPIGVPGELCVGGHGLARGYLNQPVLTADRFVPNPFGSPGTRLYRTGDRARFLEDGTIEFLGRLDAQVKVRGFRVELGEVEHALRAQAGVRDVVVVIRHDDGDKRLAAYVVMEGGEGDTNGLRHELARVLPDYMMPSWLIALDQLPLTASGKVDRSQLPAPSPQRPREHEFPLEPTTEVQRAMYAIWSDVLGVERFSVHANFFDLGGHSLLGITLAARIREQMNVELPLRRLFEHPTVASLTECVVAASAEVFARGRRAAFGQYLFELNPGRGTKPVFFLPGGVGGDEEFLVYARLVHFVGGGYRFFGLRARSADGIEASHRSAEDMARDYLAEVCRQQAHGPYLLVGNCIGGVLAFEIARQLEAIGETVGALVLMDTDYPTPQRYARHRWAQVREHLKRRANVPHYLSRVSHHRDRLAALEWSEKLRYLRGRAVVVAGRVAGSIDAPEVAQDVRQSYVATLRRYTPKKFGGAATLILSQQQKDAGATSGWSEVIGGPLTTLSSPGNHHTYVRDHVKLVAQQLRECLDRATGSVAPEDAAVHH